MTDTHENNSELMLAEYTSEIIAAYVSNHIVQPGDLAQLIGSVYGALKGAGSSTAVDVAVAQKPKPPVPIRKSIEAEYLICLEDGLKFKSLKRHLKTSYNMTPEEYRQKWELPPDYPMVAPAYAAARSRLAKEMGLGRFSRAIENE